MRVARSGWSQTLVCLGCVRVAQNSRRQQGRSLDCLKACVSRLCIEMVSDCQLMMPKAAISACAKATQWATASALRA